MFAKLKAKVLEKFICLSDEFISHISSLSPFPPLSAHPLWLLAFLPFGNAICRIAVDFSGRLTANNMPTHAAAHAYVNAYTHTHTYVYLQHMCNCCVCVLPPLPRTAVGCCQTLPVIFMTFPMNTKCLIKCRSQWLLLLLLLLLDEHKLPSNAAEWMMRGRSFATASGPAPLPPALLPQRLLFAAPSCFTAGCRHVMTRIIYSIFMSLCVSRLVCVTVCVRVCVCCASARAESVPELRFFASL